MNKSFFSVFRLLIIVLSVSRLSPLVFGADQAGDWNIVTRDAELTIFSRSRPGSQILEIKGVGSIDAPTGAVKRAIDDTAEYPKFMPYVVETRTISRIGDSQRVGYQRLSLPIVGDRDYTVRVRCESKPCSKTGGVIYCNRWEAANDLGPAEKKGVTRVKITEGSWLLEPTTGGKTRATYTIYSDSGGGIPSMILNSANKTVIPKLFAAIRKQASLEKYSR